MLRSTCRSLKAPIPVPLSFAIPMARALYEITVYVFHQIFKLVCIVNGTKAEEALRSSLQSFITGLNNKSSSETSDQDERGKGELPREPEIMVVSYLLRWCDFGGKGSKLCDFSVLKHSCQPEML